VTLTALGGEPKDLISTKCSFFNFLTSNIVWASELFASATAASAYVANLVASSYCFVASASSLATTFYVSSASYLSTFNFSIIFNVSILAYSNLGYISLRVILISSTASFAATNLSNPPLSLCIY